MIDLRTLFRGISIIDSCQTSNADLEKCMPQDILEQMNRKNNASRGGYFLHYSNTYISTFHVMANAENHEANPTHRMIIRMIIRSNDHSIE